MNEVVAIVEGETEQTFIRNLLAPHLPLFGVNIWGVLPGRNRRRGGIKNWAVAKADILRTLREGRYCTTMFDYYALPNDWPGRIASKGLPWQQRAARVESELLAEIVLELGASFNAKYFIPYIQLHEFESLAFADVEKLASVTAPLRGQSAIRQQERFAKIIAECGEPEAINDGYATCPSRRIHGVEQAYRKRVHGPIVTDRIGLTNLRKSCHHFGDWLARLESLAPKSGMSVAEPS